MVNYFSNSGAEVDAGRWPSFFPNGADVNAEFRNGPIQGIAVNPDLACGLNLVSAGFSQNRNNEMFLEFVDSFGVEDSSVVHARNESVQLISYCARVRMPHVWCWLQFHGAALKLPAH